MNTRMYCWQDAVVCSGHSGHLNLFIGFRHWKILQSVSLGSRSIQAHLTPSESSTEGVERERERESALQQLSVQRSFEASMGGIVQGLSVQGGSWYLNGGPFVQASHFHPARRTATNPVCASGVVTAVPLGCVEEVCVCVCVSRGLPVPLTA